MPQLGTVMNQTIGTGFRQVAMLTAGLVVSLLAVSHQSFWIDETLTGWKASLPTFSGWWQEMVRERASDLQMPLYMLFIWGWEKVFGHGEWALRAANIGWFLAGLMAIDRATRLRLGTAVSIVLMIAPFSWYYLDEARPYAMQLSASLMVAAALTQFIENPHRLPLRTGWTVLFVFGASVLAGSSMLGAVWLGAAFLLLISTIPQALLLSWCRRQAAILTLLFIWLAGLAAYYVWTLRLGARATAAATTDFRNVAFVIYELFGFSGLGPGRTELRQSGFAALIPYFLPLACYGGVAAIVVSAGGGCVLQAIERRIIRRGAWIFGLTFLALVGLGVITHFRVLGRHFTPFWPIIGLLMGAGMYQLWKRAGGGGKIIVAAFVALCLFSSGSFRIAKRHAKDDYRSASEFARNALGQGNLVWWNAEKTGGRFYGLMFEPASTDSKITWVANPVPGFADGLPIPDRIITSKPDLYDSSGALAAYVKTHHFEQVAVLPAFRVWQRRVAD